MSSLKQKRSSVIDKSDDENNVEIDVVLDLITTILPKQEDKCICSNIVTQDDLKSTFTDNEVIPSLEVPKRIDNKIKLSDIIAKLKLLGFCLTGAMISMFTRSAEDFVLIGSDPLDSSILIDATEASLLRLKAVCNIEEKYFSKLGEVQATGNRLSLNLSRSTSSFGNKKNRRTKERKIGYIIEKVNAWRKLYNGIENDYGERTRYSLDQGAKIIGISKKSLDDYLLQLRLGRKYGFDFNLNKDSKVGVLRTFVKKHRGEKSIKEK